MFLGATVLPVGAASSSSAGGTVLLRSELYLSALSCIFYLSSDIPETDLSQLELKPLQFFWVVSERSSVGCSSSTR